MAYLYEDFDSLRRLSPQAIKETPECILRNLNPKFELRPYQEQAFENFVIYFEGGNTPKPLQLLFHMATGSGKTLIMAGLMVYLYKQGYRNFLFFVNLSNIVEKTKDNFLNGTSSKFLFANEIVIDGSRVQIRQVDNFQYSNDEAINICFTTTQGLHTDMWTIKENCISLDDFDGRKVVLLSDEAHHLNVDTKSNSKKEEESRHTWEETVKAILKRNADNILLEFTATCDLNNEAIRKEYKDKIIFDYSLSKFYRDKYSKDIETVRIDLPSVMDRAISALVTSQFRLKLFQENRLNIKPVVLLKSISINESKVFKRLFEICIRRLDANTLERIKQITQSNDFVYQAFNYFERKGITLEALAAELRDDFSPSHCISVNEEGEAIDKQLVLNTLEDADNPYRAIFEVRKLDEGWDVLNLFDIVRLYETRQSGGKKTSPSTISEAQLIGRGARYCPFRLNEEQPLHQRKYDEDVKNDLRACETLYYHCQNDSRYIGELHNALLQIGLDFSKKVQRHYVLKDLFKEDDLYTDGLVYLNKRIKKQQDANTGLSDDIKNKLYTYRLLTGATAKDSIMEQSLQSVESSSKYSVITLSVSEIAKTNYAIVNKALAKYPAFRFDKLKGKFPTLESTRQFITDDKYLGSIKTEIQTYEANPSVATLHAAMVKTLGVVANAISSIETAYCGTKDFYPKKIKDAFTDKTVNYTNPHDGGVGVSQDDPNVDPAYKINLSKENWFVYNDNYGTSEEKAFVSYFQKHIAEFQKKYSKVFLVRNEKAVHIYSFDGGQRFEPDYVLFLKKDAEKGFEYIQLFIEPKGDQLLEKDKWKEQFLLQLKEEPVEIIADDSKYKIWGLHFFNLNNRMKEFVDDMQELVNDHNPNTATPQ